MYTFAKRGNKKGSLPNLPVNRSSIKNNKEIFNSLKPYNDRSSRKAGTFDKPYRSVSQTKPLDSIDVNDEEEPDKPFLGEAVRMGSPVAEQSPYQDKRSRNSSQIVASGERNYMNTYLEAQQLVQAHQ